MMDTRKVITLDARRRVTLKNIGKPEHRLYSVEEDPNGTLYLTPVKIVPAVPEQRNDS